MEEIKNVTDYTLDQYQRDAHVFSLDTEIGGDKLMYPLIGLSGEVGELCNRIKKVYRRQTPIRYIDLYHIEAEMGDILWYMAEICTQLNLNLNHIARMNIDKLDKRKEAGVLIDGTRTDDRPWPKSGPIIGPLENDRQDDVAWEVRE